MDSDVAAKQCQKKQGKEKGTAACSTDIEDLSFGSDEET